MADEKNDVTVADNAPDSTPTPATPPAADGGPVQGSMAGNAESGSSSDGTSPTPHHGDMTNQETVAAGASAPAATADGRQTADGTSPTGGDPRGRGPGGPGGGGRGGPGGGGGGGGGRGRGGPGGGRGGPGGNRGRGRGRRDEESSDGIESSVIRIYRCSKVVKGGRTFSFAALVVAGDRGGSVGIGYGKANEVPSAVEKATKEARRAMVKLPLKGTTIPHEVIGASGSSRLKMIPARPGTGVTAGKTVRPLLELAGVSDVLTKAYGSTSPKNLLKATMDALKQLQSAEAVAKNRGVELAKDAGSLEAA
jgi:small subunit ribosomal protein S5